jgi:tetratricopeptide (TPR) repeat protein
MGYNNLSKVDILIQQNKLNEAEKLLTDMLAGNPNDFLVLDLLAEVNLQRNKLDEANLFIDNAMQIAPNVSQLFFTKSRIRLLQNKRGEAEKYIHEAIRLNPYDAAYFSILAYISIENNQFEEALENANKALEVDAENLTALNVRSAALNKLNRSEEAFATIENALREDPNNAYTHANYGWGLLEKGDHKKALNHFKEALKNDPHSDYAQAGMLEALKSTNPVYRAFLKYAFFMDKSTTKLQWGFIIAFYVIVMLLNQIADHNETFRPFLTPIIFLLVFIAFSTWIITPISNLFLRFNRYGQVLLNKKEKMSSNFVAVSLGIFFIGLLLYFIMSDTKFLTIAVFGFAMMVPCSTMFSPSKRKNFLLIFACVLAFVGIASIVQTFLTGQIWGPIPLVFIIGFVAFQWIANFMLIKGER